MNKPSVFQTLHQYHAAAQSHQLTIPITAMALTIGLYFARPLFSDTLTSLTCIGPCVAVLATWMTLPATPKRLQAWFLLGSLLWCFALWYAFPTPSEYTSMEVAKYHATYVCIVGGTIAVGVVIRIVSSLRYCHRDLSDEWPLSAKWGLMDLMTLSMGVALAVSAFTAAKISNLFTDHGMVCGIGFFAGIVLILLVTASWRSLTVRSWRKIPAFCVLIPMFFWTFSFCENISLRSAIDQSWGSESKWGYFMLRLLTIDQFSWQASVRFAVFASVIVIPLLASLQLGIGLHSLPKPAPSPSARPLRWLLTVARWSPSILMLGFLIFLSQASWSMVFEELRLSRSGWPFIYHETSSPQSMFVRGPAAPGILVVRDSWFLRATNLVITLVPSFVLLTILCIRKRQHSESGDRAGTFTKLLFAQFVFVYIGPAIFCQHFADHPRLYQNRHAISWLTQSAGGVNWKQDRIVIESDQEFDELLLVKNGLRSPRIVLRHIHLTHRRSRLLAENHCLRYLTIEKCTWDHDLSFLLSVQRLHQLILKEVTLSSGDTLAIANCASLFQLELHHVDAPQWSRWPKNVVTLAFMVSPEEQQPIELKDLSALQTVMLQSQVGGYQGKIYRQAEPVQIEFIRCSTSGLNLLAEPSVPIHLKLEATQLYSLTTIHLRQLPWLKNRPSQMPRHVDLRSFDCDKIDSIRRFEATIANCESFECHDTPSGLPRGIASIVLDGIPFPTSMESHRMERMLTIPNAPTRMEQRKSDHVLSQLCGSLNISDLNLRGLNASSQQLRNLIANNNLGTLNIDVPISAQEIASLTGKTPNLNELTLVNTQLDQATIDKIFTACPVLTYLAFDASNLQTIDLSKGTLLKSLAFSHDSFPKLDRASQAKLQSISFGNESIHPQFSEPQLAFYDVPPDLALVKTWTQMHPGAYLTLSNEKAEIDSLSELHFKDVKVLSIHGYQLNRKTIDTWKVEGRKPSQLSATRQTLETQEDAEFLNWIRQRVTPHVWVWSGEP